jgi:hypothetical protein
VRQQTSEATRSSSRLPNPSGGEERTCRTCDSVFLTRAAAGGRRQLYCSDGCFRISYNRENRAKIEDGRLRHDFGITLGDYLRILDLQGGRCVICRRPPTGNRLAVDHDHATGRVRGLLCAPCNRHVGYLEKWGAAVLAYMDGPVGTTPKRGYATELDREIVAGEEEPSA